MEKDTPSTLMDNEKAYRNFFLKVFIQESIY
jgi:hypothetical protein